MGFFEDYRESRLRKYFTTHYFLTIDPGRFLDKVYDELYDKKGNKKMELTGYADTLLDIIHKMLKCSNFEEVERPNGESCIDNDIVFLGLTKSFWSAYNSALKYYESEIPYYMDAWYDAELSKQEREDCHTRMVDLICERDMFNNALERSQQLRRLYSTEEKRSLIDERTKLANIGDLEFIQFRFNK